MTLRPGRADLFERLDKAAARYADAGMTDLVALLEEAAKAILKCPVAGCAYCFAVEQQEATR